MPINSVGDQARAYALQTASNKLKHSLSTLTAEMASGESADIGMRLQGNTRVLNGVEARIASVTQFQRNVADGSILTQGVQDMLSGLRATISGLGIDLASDPFAATSSQLGLRAAQVASAFEDAVNLINGAVAGRHVMGGLATAMPPITSAAEILDELEIVTAGLTTAADVSQAIADWFDLPPGGGGFLDSAYNGTVGTSQRFAVAEGITAALSTSAASPEIREMLRSLSTAAILDRGTLGGDINQARELLQIAGSSLIKADKGLITEMGRVGLTQQIIERASTTNIASLSVLNLSRNDMRLADPFETAAALSEVQSQLEALYAVTVRISKLKLVDFLR